MEEIDLKELFNIFWSKKIQILIVVILFIVVGGVYSYGLKTPKYTASTTLVLAMAETSEKTKEQENTITTTDVTLNSKLVSTYSELVKSKKILRKVIKNLQINMDEDVLRANVKVTSVEDTELIRKSFSLMREIAERMQEKFKNFNLSELSMGMTHDFEIAIQEGSTEVRVGTAIFGQRT